MRKTLLIGLLVVIVASLGMQDAMASHFRFGHLSWKPRPDISPTTVEFTLVNAFRRNGYPGSGGDGFPITGDIINEFVGFTQLLPGDGTALGSPLQYEVIAFDMTNNWINCRALDPNTGGNTIIHTYPAPSDPAGGPWVAEISSCCRIAALVNASNASYRVLTLVETASGGSSPVSTLTPIIPCPINTVCQFAIPAADVDGGDLSFRLSSSPESFIPAQPSASFPLSIDPVTGIVTWNTAGTAIGQLYACQITIEDKDPNSGALNTTVAVDFIIEITAAPVCPPPVCSINGGGSGESFMVNVGDLLSFTVEGSTPDPSNCDDITINTGGLPAGATMTPLLPVSGPSPQSSTFNWTPTGADVGVHVVLFTVTDASGQQSQCVVDIEVRDMPGCCVQPQLSLVGYSTVSYAFPLWEVRVEMANNGPCDAYNVNATMIPDAPWLVIPDPNCAYGNIANGASSDGAPDSYTFDLTAWPGGSFNVFFDVSYEDECGNQYAVRLDPELNPGDPTGTNGPSMGYDLKQNVPNPFNPTTSISFETPSDGVVSLKVYDVSGQLVRTLLSEFKLAGQYTESWDGKDDAGKAVSSGVYFYRMEAGQFTQTRRMVLLK